MLIWPRCSQKMDTSMQTPTTTLYSQLQLLRMSRNLLRIFKSRSPVLFKTCSLLTKLPKHIVSEEDGGTISLASTIKRRALHHP